MSSVDEAAVELKRVRQTEESTVQGDEHSRTRRGQQVLPEETALTTAEGKRPTFTNCIFGLLVDKITIKMF